MFHAAVLIGHMPVGPKCAKRANLLPLAERRSGLVFRAVRYSRERTDMPQTRDLFEGVVGHE